MVMIIVQMFVGDKIIKLKMIHDLLVWVLIGNMRSRTYPTAIREYM